jgi:NADH:ubiquinone oxidoreductase subunit K
MDTPDTVYATVGQGWGVTVLTAHKILITSAVAMFLVYSARELHNYTSGDASALLRSIAAGIAAVGLAVYLRWVWIRRPSDSPRR